MKIKFTTILCCGLILTFFNFADAQSKKKNEIAPPKNYQPLKFINQPELQTILSRAVDESLTKFPDFKLEEVAATLIDLRDTSKATAANVRGAEKIYPASVVKMFYMFALEQQLENGKIKLTPELERGLRDMITVSSNEATQYVLDAVTDTSGGAELSAKDFAEWSFARNKVNRFYDALGYRNINVNQKTFCEDAYGREQQFRGANGENRNKLTTDAAARLMAEIVVGKAANAERTKIMMDLMRRDWEAQIGVTEDREFVSYALQPGTKLWTKEGYTSKTRHDAAYIETPDGLKFVIVIFTENHADEKKFIPSIVTRIIADLRTVK